MPYSPHETIAERIKRAGLPEDHDVHWSRQRKQNVVKAVHEDIISFEEARARYLLSRAEYRSWEEELGDEEDLADA